MIQVTDGRSCYRDVKKLLKEAQENMLMAFY